MRKVLKWLGIGLGVLVGLLLLALAGVLGYGEIAYGRTHDRPIYPITADTSPEGIAHGEYLVRAVMACADCHAPEGSSEMIGTSEQLSVGPIRATLVFPNLTPDEETGLGAWTDAEIARAIREGLSPDGRELRIMPSSNFHRLSDADTAAIIGYLRSQEPVRSELPERSANAFAKAMFVLPLGLPEAYGPAITQPQNAPEPGTLEYGAYLTSLAGCRDCHKSDFSGGRLPFSESDVPPAPNLTSGGSLGDWSEADFVKTLHTGIRPDGSILTEDMPWRVYTRMTDDDLGAIYQYLMSLPAR
ncbi:MAG: cytochrome c [Chloroflexi bacterium]|nr:cytochrome c [Chloroflexota bacterium]